MAALSGAITAGIAGGGTAGTSLAWFAPLATALPTTTGATLNAAFKDAGWVADTGLTEAVNETTKDIFAFGTTSPVRTLIQTSKRSFKLTFLESNTTSLAIYHRLPLTFTSTTGGVMALTEGPPSNQRWAAVFDVVDGTNLFRMACPIVQNTTISDLTISAGNVIEYSVELTAYPDSTGVSVYKYLVVPAVGP